MRKLLKIDGSIWVQINDDEQAYLKVLMDEVFGRNNFINMISVNMKNNAGASGGGEDKRLKKNCEYILLYARDYQNLNRFQNAYNYIEMSELIEQYKSEGKSWKYTTVLVDSGQKEYIGSTVDGNGDEIKIFKRINVITKSVSQLAKEENLSEKDVYKKYGMNIFQTTNAQTSIRTRIIEYKTSHSIHDDVISIEYVPKTGKNKDITYEQFYKGNKCRLFVWLRDTSEIINGLLYKKELQGTYWDFNAYMKNLTKEGSVLFANGKKPEALVQRIFDMATNPGDLVLDSFLGSGTTAAVAHKMNRRYIGIEMGEHAYTHCKLRLDKVIEGSDLGGITKAVDWQGGGGYRFYELAPTLIKKDPFGEDIINPAYNADNLAASVALLEGYDYQPDGNVFWKQSLGAEHSYLFVTTRHINQAYLASIQASMEEHEYLLIACRSFEAECHKAYKNIAIKKIPQMLLKKCEFDKDDYNLHIINTPLYEQETEDIENVGEISPIYHTAHQRRNVPAPASDRIVAEASGDYGSDKSPKE